MIAHFILKLRCPLTHVALRQLTQKEREQLNLPAHEEALVTTDLRYYYVTHRGLPTLLPDAARKWPVAG